mgnify:FL=1
MNISDFSRSAMAAASKCPKKHSIMIGDHVTILNEDYFGQTGVVVREGLNGLGLPLLDIWIDGRKQGTEYEPCFYPQELEKIDD